MATLGARLRHLRRERGCTLQEVSDGSGLTPSFLSRLERGIVNISVGNLRKVASFFGVPITFFFTEELVPRGIVVHAAIPSVQVLEREVRQSSLLPTEAGHLLAEVVMIPPGKAAQAFRTRASRALFYILAGELTCELDDRGQVVRLSAGDVLYQRRPARPHWSNEGVAATVLVMSLQPEER